MGAEVIASTATQTDVNKGLADVIYLFFGPDLFLTHCK